MRVPNQQITEEDVEKAIEDYLQNVPALLNKFIYAPKPQDERYWFNVFGQQPYLLVSKFDLETLPIRILRRLPVHLIKQFVVQVELDSLWYWALTHDVVLRSYGQSDFDKWPMKPVLEALMATHLARLGSAPYNSTIERLNRVIDDAILQPVKDLVHNKHIILSYLCYPVLEGLTKLTMATYIDSDGRVTRAFSDGKKQRKPGEQISNLATLLRALEKNADSLLLKPDLGLDLRDFRLEVEKLDLPRKQSDDGWDSIYRLRIVSAHGVTHPQLRAGLVTNLICLIAWHLLDEKVLSSELKRMAEMPRHFRTMWDFDYYPPEP
jgi:hypothetical protein